MTRPRVEGGHIKSDLPAWRLHWARRPTANQTRGIRKRQTISASTLERLKAFAFAWNTHGEAGSGSGTAGDVMIPSEFRRDGGERGW